MTMFSVTGRTPQRDLSVFYADGDNATVPESHPQFAELLERVMHGADDEEVRSLVDVILGAAQKLTLLSERVSTKGRSLFFDGDEIHGVLVDTIVETIANGESDRLSAVVNFLEKVKTNPDIRSIDDLYRWITNGDLLIHEDGDFLAYKWTRGHGSERKSVNEGNATVDGEEITGQIPNYDGATVTMPRSRVDDNEDVACSTGLHAGTHGYTEWFGSGDGETVLVKINPRDVVSVPSDHSSQKLRVCRYVVQHVVAGRLDNKIYVQPEALWDQSTLGDEEDRDEDDGLDLDTNPDYFEDDYLEEEFDEDEDEDEATFTQAGTLTSEGLTTVQTINGPIMVIDAEEPAEAPEKAVRNSKGQFTSDSVKFAVRDSLGRFRGFKGDNS